MVHFDIYKEGLIILDLNIWHFCLLFLTGSAAGFVDSIAGGGGLIALPVLFSIGLPPDVALGTNKLQGSFGTMTGAFCVQQMSAGFFTGSDPDSFAFSLYLYLTDKRSGS